MALALELGERKALIYVCKRRWVTRSHSVLALVSSLGTSHVSR
jgi:hypothetical protein